MTYLLGVAHFCICAHVGHKINYAFLSLLIFEMKDELLVKLYLFHVLGMIFISKTVRTSIVRCESV